MTNISELPKLPEAGFYNICRGSLYVIEPQYAENLCINPSFEVDTYNWSGGTLSQVQNPYVGANSLRNTAGGTITYGATVPLILTTGSMYAFSFYAYTPSATQSVTMTVTVLDASSVARGQWTTTLAPQQWTRFSGTTLIATASASFTFTINVSAGVTLDIDAVQVELDAGYGATTYLDGSLQGFVNEAQTAVEQYMWLGNPHASASARASTVSSGGRIIDLAARFGFQLIGVIGGDNPSPNNQIITYNGSDGAALQDIIIQPRTVTFIGRISANTARELHQKISFFQAYFARDNVAYRQQRAFIFQHTNELDAIGIPMTFSGVIEGSMQFTLANTFDVQCSIQVKMLDPYFYGHDLSRKVDQAVQAINLPSFGYIPNYTVRNDTSVADGAFFKSLGGVNGNVEAITELYDGRIVFAGNFTTVNSVSYAYIAVYNPQTNLVSGIGTTPSTVFNARVRCLCTTLDRKGLFIGGDFTTANGVAANRIVFYNAVTGTFSVVGSGAGGGYNGAVHTMKMHAEPRATISGILHGRLYIGGAFTQTGAFASQFRISLWDPATGLAGAFLTLGTSNGMNNTVFAMDIDYVRNRVYIGGAFNSSQGGVVNAFPAIAYLAIGSTYNPLFTNALTDGFDSAAYTIYTLYFDNDNNILYIGGYLVATLAGVTTTTFCKYQYDRFTRAGTSVGFNTDTTRAIVPYRKQLLVTTTLNIYLYNGQSTRLYRQMNNLVGFASAFTSNTGFLYLGVIYTALANAMKSRDLMVIDSSTTAGCVSQIALYGDISAFVITNESQQTEVDFFASSVTGQVTIVDLTTTAIYSTQLIKQVDIGYGTTNSIEYGSGIMTFRVMPGRNFISIGTTGTGSAYLIYKQTFSSIFDGIRAS